MRILIVGEISERDTSFFRVTELFLDAFRNENPSVLSMTEYFHEYFDVHDKRFRVYNCSEWKEAGRQADVIINIHDYTTTQFLNDYFWYKTICCCPVDSISHFSRAVKYFIPHTKHSREYYLRYGLCTNVVRIPPRTIYGEDVAALESDRRSARNCFGIGDNELCLLLVGDYGIRKNYEIFFDALRYVETSRLKVIIVSRDFPDKIFSHIIEDCHIKDRVCLFNVETTREMLHLLYLAADVYVSTSHGEGICLPFIDAIGYGLPCFVPYHTAFKDYEDFPEIYYSHPWYTGYVYGLLGTYYDTQSISLYQGIRDIVLPMRPIDMERRFAILKKRIECGMQTKSRFEHQIKDALSLLKARIDHENNK